MGINFGRVREGSFECLKLTRAKNPLPGDILRSNYRLMRKDDLVQSKKIEWPREHPTF